MSVKQLDEVDLDVAGVGPSGDGRHVDARAATCSRSLAPGRGVAQREGLDDAEHVVDVLAPRVAELAHGLVRGRGERSAQPLVGARLELAGAPVGPHGRPAQRVEQHGLADAAQAGQHDRALGATAGDALEHDVEGAQLLVTAGELGRALARARGVRVRDRVHARRLYASLPET